MQWRPTPDEDLEREISAALSRPGASRVVPTRPVGCSDGRSGWLWGRMRTAAGAWLGLATLYSSPWEYELTWQPADQLRTLD
ncbi:hypothetical protein [Blastococcus sp. CCUG 61487]|uniref:hypothetical protein n=1 Tax=Blastococcus sp. CCUG 61487 TaxID=1840703 RepID=UPI0010BFECB4|nr:hypothetical protein [Blastococcus sp. CCUG 61487]TKJ24355.1 hypothetical protein A6V29_04985 [Blastococcus sp. CCUG 61487]